MNKKKQMTAQRISLTGLMTAILCMIGPMSVAIPFSPVPISLTNLILYLTVYLLGRRLGAVSCLVYLLIGLIGLPVYSGFMGGIGKLLGPTGGYLMGFVFFVWIGGWFLERYPEQNMRHRGLQILGLVLGTCVDYAFGTVWLACSAGMGPKAALTAGVLPFLPWDFLKISAAAVLGPVIRARLLRAGLLSDAVHTAADSQ